MRTLFLQCVLCASLAAQITNPPSGSGGPHTHVKTDITDWTHGHTKSQITDFSHTHIKADISNFAVDWTELTGKPLTFAPSAHTHDWAADITGKPASFASDWNTIANKPSTFTPDAHTHVKANITDSAHTHLWADISNPPTMPLKIASGSATFATTAIASGACSAVVTVAATGATVATDTISWNYRAQPTAATDGRLHMNAWITANNVNFCRQNPTAASITPTALVISWMVQR